MKSWKTLKRNLEMDYVDAKKIADLIVTELSPFCKRIAIGGSLRRLSPEMKDIEIIALPRDEPVNDLFGEPESHYKLLDYLNSGFVRRLPDGTEVRRRIKGQEKYFQFSLIEGIALDLFVVTPPAQWGVIFALRTGPANFSKLLVTNKKHNGYLPDGFVVRGWVVCKEFKRNESIRMDEEIDFLNFCGLKMIEPHMRI